MDATTAFAAVPLPMDPQVCSNASSTTAAARTTTTSPVFSPVSAAAAAEATITDSGDGALSTILTESCTGDDGIGTQKMYAPHQVYDEGEGVLDDNDDASSYYTSLNDTSSNCDNGMSSSVVMTNKTSSRYYD